MCLPPPPIGEVDAAPRDRFRRHSVAAIRTDLCRQLTVAERYICFAEGHSAYTSLRHKKERCTPKFTEAILHVHRNDGTKGEGKIIQKKEVVKKGKCSYHLRNSQTPSITIHALVLGVSWVQISARRPTKGFVVFVSPFRYIPG